MLEDADRQEKSADFQKVSTFNQFEGKKSTYDFSLYTSSLDEKKVTEQQRVVAKRVEQELIQKG